MEDSKSDNSHVPKTDGDEVALSSSIIDDLITRARTILSEVEALRDRLRALRQQGTVETGHFRGTVQSELGMLEKLASKPESDSTNHIARSSNLPFLEHVWSAAKQSKDLVALQKRLYVDSAFKGLSMGMHYVDLKANGQKEKSSRENAVVVDAITNAGRKWIKVSLVTNARLLFDLAKQGWECGDSDNEDDEIKSLADRDDDDRDVPLLKTAKQLTKASRQFRVRTKHPAVHLVLPRIQPGETVEIDKIVEECRACGANIFCGPDLRPQPTLQHALESMAPDPLVNFSDTLNIDCTILLALVSEFSHASVSKEPWFHAALQRQVEIEDSENLLPSLLYPALSDRKLVCTYEAAKRMREIVDTIGTPSEKARTAILMGDESKKSREDLVSEMQQWSAYAVPSTWQVPIVVVEQDPDHCQLRLPEAASVVSAQLTTINQSVFLYGWATGRTTITSNRSVVKQIESGLEKYEDLDNDAWPKIWLCPTARSLVGKEKRGAPKGSQKIDMQLVDRGEGVVRNGIDPLPKDESHEIINPSPNEHSGQEVRADETAVKT